MSSALTLSQGLPGINKRLKRTRTRLMACVPIDGTSQPFLQRNSCTEIKITFGTRYIECPPRLPVKLRCVPNDFPFVTGEPCGILYGPPAVAGTTAVLSNLLVIVIMAPPWRRTSVHLC